MVGCGTYHTQVTHIIWEIFEGCVCVCAYVCVRVHACAFCILLHDTIQLGAVFFIHLMFLADRSTHEQVKNFHYGQFFFPKISTMLEPICILKISITELTII